MPGVRAANVMEREVTRPAGKEVTPVDWRSSAACLVVDPELFFPTGTTAPAMEQAEAAKAVCALCPVTHLCLDWAVTNKQEHGVWGGLDEFERRRLGQGSGWIRGYRKRSRRDHLSPGAPQPPGNKCPRHKPNCNGRTEFITMNQGALRAGPRLPPPSIQIAHVPDCPLREKLLWAVEQCLAEMDVRWPIDLIVADCASPTLLVDGLDITTGRSVELGVPSCRVSLPQGAEIQSALHSAWSRRQDKAG